MFRELDAALSPVHLSVVTPAAELLHRTIAVRCPRGLKAPKNGFPCMSFLDNHCTSTLLCHIHVPRQCPHHLDLKLQVISALPFFGPSVHVRSHKFFLCDISQAYVLFSVLLVLDFWFALLQEPPYPCSFLQRPFSHPGSNGTDKLLLCSAFNLSLCLPKAYDGFTSIDRIRSTC